MDFKMHFWGFGFRGSVAGRCVCNIRVRLFVLTVEVFLLTVRFCTYGGGTVSNKTTTKFQMEGTDSKKRICICNYRVSADFPQMRTPKEAYSTRGRSRQLLEPPFSEPLPRTLLRTLFDCKTHRKRPPSQNPSQNPSENPSPEPGPEPGPEPSQNPSQNAVLPYAPLGVHPRCVGRRNTPEEQSVKDYQGSVWLPWFFKPWFKIAGSAGGKNEVTKSLKRA